MIASRSRLKGTELDFYPLATLSKAGLPDPSGLPMTLKVLIEGLLRLSEAGATDEENVKTLAAWPKLKSDVVLLVAGEPWWEAKYEQQHNVVFDLRFIPDAEVATYFAAADVVLAPYRIEAQSGVALTSLHFARPVIASRAGGLPEIVRDGVNGYLVPVDDADALAHASGFLRTELSRRLDLYSVPQLHFAYDDSIETGIRMSQLIDEAIAADKLHPQG